MACVNMAPSEVVNSSSISSITAVQSVSVILLSCDLLGLGPQYTAQSSLHSFLFFSRKAFCGPLAFSLACVVLSHFSCVRLFATLCTVAHQVPLSVGFSRQEYWSGMLCPPPRDIPRIKPVSLSFLALAGDSLPLAPPGKPLFIVIKC